MRGIPLNRSWAILLALLSVVTLDQTTDLLNPTVKLDLSGLRKLDLDFSGLHEVEKSSSGTPVFDVTGLRKFDPAGGGAELDFSAGGSRLGQVSKEISFDVGESRPVVPIATGVTRSDPSLRYLAPLTIETSARASYFVKLINRRSGSTVMTFYVVGGRPLTVLAPLGTYRMRYASGSQLMGERELFGSETATAEADATSPSSRPQMATPATPSS